MNETLRVALLQMRQIQKDCRANLATVESAFGQLPPGTELAVLPEMWITGFMTSKGELDRTLLRESFEAGRETMSRLSRTYHTALYGSLIEPLEEEEGRLYNSGLFYDPSGELIGYYPKHQLFGPGGERDYFKAGDRRVQIAYGGFQIRLAVCYDLRFPVWLRQDESLGLYDLLLVCANWPEPRQDHWQTLLRARAIENQAYVAAANRIGPGPGSLTYPGLSALLDGWGKEIHAGDNRAEGWLTAELKRSALSRLRTVFPVLDTLDHFRLR